MAQRDGLTGLYNSLYLRDALDRELARSRRAGRPFSLVFADIDHFKTFNDTHGHLAGDDVLRTVAKLIEAESRSTTTAARFGGEEFVLLLPEQDKEGASVYAEKLRRGVEGFAMRGEESQPLGKITLSIGVATFPVDGDTADELLDRADQAMYRARPGATASAERRSRQRLRADRERERASRYARPQWARRRLSWCSHVRKPIRPHQAWPTLGPVVGSQRLSHLAVHPQPTLGVVSYQQWLPRE